MSNEKKIVFVRFLDGVIFEYSTSESYRTENGQLVIYKGYDEVARVASGVWQTVWKDLPLEK